MSSKCIPRVTRKNLALAALAVLTSAIPLGCSQSDGRLAIDGTVTVDDKPLAVGLINFQPLGSTCSTGAGTGIEQGRFIMPAKRGLLPGKYRVIIQAFRETGRMIDDPQRGKIPETVPIHFNQSGVLEAIVTEGGPNRFDFKLTSVP